MDLSGQHSEITFFRTTEDLSPFTEDEVKIDVVIEFDIYVIFRLACSSDFVGTVEMTVTNEEGIDGNPDRTRKIGEADLVDRLHLRRESYVRAFRADRFQRGKGHDLPGEYT